MNVKILVVEDDPTLNRGLCDNLNAQGWDTRSATDGEEGLSLALAWNPDLIFLDLMLPKINGYEICHSIRLEGIQTPILILTAKGQTEDIVKGLELGADDYIVKPFALQELLARVKSHLRRRNSGATRFSFDDGYLLDTESRQLTQHGKEINLTPKEFGILTFFLNNAGRALSRDQLLSKVWGHRLIVTHRSVDRCIKTLRQKLDQKSQQALSTVRGIGYRWDGEVEGEC